MMHGHMNVGGGIAFSITMGNIDITRCSLETNNMYATSIHTYSWSTSVTKFTECDKPEAHVVTKCK